MAKGQRKGLKHTVTRARTLSRSAALAAITQTTQSLEAVKLSAQKIHSVIAEKPHTQLMSKWAWYSKWHNWRLHWYANASILGIYIFIVAAVLLFTFRSSFAADLTNTWNFGISSNFTFDPNTVETNGTSARLKAQNYATDANTAALYHLDEASGTSAADSSGNSNTGTLRGGPSFTTGNLNNGVTLSGTGQYISALDSASLTLTGQQTIEAWTKFSSTFNTNADQDQGIVDKGSYKLAYDRTSGKINYELADPTANTWVKQAGNRLNGSWQDTGYGNVGASIVNGTDVYIGVGGNVPYGSSVSDVEVWKQSGTTLTKIGGRGLNNSWTKGSYDSVNAFAINGTTLYAALGSDVGGDAEVWSCNMSTSCSSWTQIGGSVNSSWTSANYITDVYSLTVMGGNLYAGVGTNQSSGANFGNGQLWKYNGTTWTLVGGNGVNSSWASGNYVMNVRSLTNDGTNIYAGLDNEYHYCGEGCSDWTDAQVWKYNGTTWSKIGGNGVSSSWASYSEGRVSSLSYYSGNLYAGVAMTTPDGSTPGTGYARVWKYNGTTWSKIGGDGVNSGWATGVGNDINSITNDGTNLYVSETADFSGGIWKYNGTAWSRVGGGNVGAIGYNYAVNLSYGNSTLYAGTYSGTNVSSSSFWGYNGTTWTQTAGNYVNNSWGVGTRTSIGVSAVYNDKLYIGKSSQSGGYTAWVAEVWELSNGVWSIVGGPGIKGGWPANTYEQVVSMQTYKGNLYVGLGTSTGDAEVWQYNGSTWTKVGGDGVNSSWSGFEVVNALAVYNGNLYAGLGNTGTESEVWQYNGSTWTKVGGSGVNSSWSTNNEVNSLSAYNGMLYAGIGTAFNQAQVWQYNGSTWTKVGGSGVNSSWSSGYRVTSMTTYNNKLTASLGGYICSTDSSVWQFDGTSWTQIAGNGLNGSWGTSSCSAASLVTYSGELYATTGTGSAGVWKYNGTSWTQVSGDGTSGSWMSGVAGITLTPYRGKLFASYLPGYQGTSEVWAIGNNAFLSSTQTSQDTNWHHIAATYNGTTMKLYIDGALNASTSAAVNIPDNTLPLLVGSTYGSGGNSGGAGNFNGKLDEVRLSSTARTSFTTLPYSATQQTVTLTNAAYIGGVKSFAGFTTSETLNGGSVGYRLSSDNGTNWKFWNGSAWTTAASLTDVNTAAVVNTNIPTFPATLQGIKWQAVITSSGTQQVTINSVTITANSDTTPPATNATNIVAKKVNGGANLAANAWTNGSSPYFSWTAATDSGSGILGYCLYLGQDNTADPVITKGLLGTSQISSAGNCQYATSATNLDTAIAGILANPLTTSNAPYYLVVKAIDNAANVYPTSITFGFRFDNTPPTNPAFITSPSGFINTKGATLTWQTSGGQAAADANSGVAGLQYKVESSGWYGDSHTGSGDNTDLLANDGSYTTIPDPDFTHLVDGTNIIYFRTWDQAGNISTTTVSAALKINTSGTPTEPQSLTANPTNNTTNAFSFSWSNPATFVGNASNLNYCYTINTLPSVSTCNYAGAGITSLSSGPYATQPGQNTLYVVARDESNNINYQSYASVQFTATTPSPGIVGNIDIVDVSVKSTSNWRLAVTWNVPTQVGIGISSYKIFRSTNGTSFSPVGTSTGTTYIDSGLAQQLYYYRVTACDSTNNCSANSPVVSLTPTGKFTEAAGLIGQPVADNITTKRSKISWTTDRDSDSKVAIGTVSGKYGDSEISNSEQVSVHNISLDNLAAGTTYYYVVKWTDVDGNTGTSQEQTFTTLPAPIIKEVSTTDINLAGGNVNFTSVGASKVSLYFGESDAFGGLKSINTSIQETAYTISLSNLKDGTKYYYQLSAFDIDGSEYRGNVFSFTTPPRPRISNLRFQPIPNNPVSTQSVSWTTNVPTTSTITYGKVGAIGQDIYNSTLVTDHTIVITNLDDNSEYFLIAQSRDTGSNLAVSDKQIFKTALDTRPPVVSSVNLEPSVRGSGAQARGQIIVSWKTDEPSTSQVAYADGSKATVFNNKTAEDTQLTTEHIVVLSNLPTSRVYSIQVGSYDKARNLGLGEPQAAIIGRPNDSVLTVVLNALQRAFGL